MTEFRKPIDLLGLTEVISCQLKHLGDSHKLKPDISCGAAVK
jgi:hypothetical protein